MSGERESLSKLLPTIYKDAAQPAVRSAGKAIGSIADLVFHPIGRCADILEKNVSKFLDKFDGEERENIVPPEPSIGVPILQKLSYTEEEELVEMYTELLKNSCLKDSKNKALPSYVNIISSLTPDEIRIIDYLFKKKYVVPISSNSVSELPPGHSETAKQIGNSWRLNVLPFFEIRAQRWQWLRWRVSSGARGILSVIISGKEWRTQARYYTDIADRVSLQKSGNIELYFDNLKAVGILEIKNDIYISPLEVYSHLENHTEMLKHKRIIEQQGLKMVLKKGHIRFTHLGSSFLKSCTANNQQKN